jgi:hypothetical protein
VQMTTEYFANRPVTILGRDYAPGDKIDDPNIKPGVLATLVNTKRIGTKVATIADPVIPAAARAQEPAATGGDQIEAGGSFALEVWRASWRAAHEATTTNLPLRHWLQQQAADRKLKGDGSNEALAERLEAWEKAQAEVDADGTHG